MSSKFTPVKIDLNGLKDGLSKDELINLINDINTIQSAASNISIFNLGDSLTAVALGIADIKKIVSK